MGYANGVKGGHAGGHLRDTLAEAIDCMQSGQVQNWPDAFDSLEEARALLGKLWHCTDIVPGDIRAIIKDVLHLDEEPWTYAQLSRVLLKDIRANANG